MTDLNKLYQDYGEFNVQFNQLNLPSPSVEYAWRRTKLILERETIAIIKVKYGRKKIKIADVGCGNGALLIRIAEAVRQLGGVEFDGYDLAKTFVDYGLRAANYKRLSGMNFFAFDLEKDDLRQQYDVIICSEVIEHLRDPKKVISKLFRHLNRGGFLILSTPNSKNLIKYPFLFLKKVISRKNTQEIAKYLTVKEQRHVLAENEQHLYVYSHGELKRLVKEAGFKTVKTFRSTTLFGGPFLDNHPGLFALSLVFDIVLDFFAIPQIGWDNIFICKKN